MDPSEECCSSIPPYTLDRVWKTLSPNSRSNPLLAVGPRKSLKDSFCQLKRMEHSDGSNPIRMRTHIYVRIMRMHYARTYMCTCIWVYLHYACVHYAWALICVWGCIYPWDQDISWDVVGHMDMCQRDSDSSIHSSPLHEYTYVYVDVYERTLFASVGSYSSYELL